MAEGRWVLDHLRPGDKPVCDLCDTKTDHQLPKCLVCNVYMCRNCTTAHQRVTTTKQHNIVTRIEREPSKSQNVSRMCQTHKQEEITFYCKPCNDFICSECILGDHRGHGGIKFNDFANQKRREMNTKLNKARDAQKLEITKITKQIEDREKENDDNDKDTENQIQARRTQVIAEVDKIFNGLTEEKMNIHQQNEDKLEAVKTQVTQGSPEFNKLCTKYNELLRTGSDMEVVMSETEMYQNLESVPSVDADIDIQISKSRFVAGNTDDKTLVSLCGYVQLYLESSPSSQSDPGSRTDEQPLTESTPGGKFDLQSHTAIPKASHKSQPETDKPSCVSPKVQVMFTFSKESKSVTSICPLSDDTAIIHYYKSYDNDIVSVDGLVKKTLKLDFVAVDLIKTSLGDIIAIDINKRSIHKLTTEGDKTQTINISPLRPVRLCEANDGNLLVTMVDKPPYTVDKSSRRLVSRISMGGTTVARYEYHNGSKLFTWPLGVAENINSDICVVDLTSLTSGRLVVLDNKGKVKFTYDGQKLHKLFVPYDVKCDKSGHVIVNDRYNMKVHILDMDARFIRYIVDEGVLKNLPICLALDKNDVLWVGCERGIVCQLQYLNQ